MKHSKLAYGFIAVPGIVFLGYAFSVMTHGVIEYSSMCLLTLAGTVILTAGICGVGRHYLKNNKGLFTLYVVQMIPACIFFSFLLLWLSSQTPSI